MPPLASLFRSPWPARSLRLGVLACVLAPIAASAAPDAPRPDGRPTGATGTGTIFGHVFTLAEHLPIPGATVSWDGGSVLTASDGTFIGPGVPAGLQTITASGDDWRPATQEVEITEGGFLFLDLHLVPISTDAPALGVVARAVLHPARPNPTAGPATIGFDVPSPGSVRLTIHDVAGRLVRDLREGTFDAGSHALRWDGRDGAGERLPAGVYVVRLEAGEFRAARKVVVQP